MNDVIPVTTVLAFGLHPIGFIVAPVCYYVLSPAPGMVD